MSAECALGLCGRGANAERSGAEGDVGSCGVGGTKDRRVGGQADGWVDGIDGLMMTRWADELPVAARRAACCPAEFEGVVSCRGRELGSPGLGDASHGLGFSLCSLLSKAPVTSPELQLLVAF